MKKIYTLTAALLMSIGSLYAQTMTITIDGIDVKDGDKLEINKLPKETPVGPMVMYDLGVDVVFRTNIAQTVETTAIDLNPTTPGIACCPPGFSCTTASANNNWTSSGTMKDLNAGREVKGEWIHYNYARTKPEEGISRQSLITFKGEKETISFTLTINVKDPNSGIKGDVDGNGNVGLGDIEAVLAVMAGDGTHALTADIDGNGTVGLGDIEAILNIMAGAE